MRCAVCLIRAGLERVPLAVPSLPRSLRAAAVLSARCPAGCAGTGVTPRWGRAEARTPQGPSLGPAAHPGSVPRHTELGVRDSHCKSHDGLSGTCHLPRSVELVIFK